MNERQERSPCPKRAMQWTGVRQSSDRGKQPDMTWGVGACASGFGRGAKIGGRRDWGGGGSIRKNGDLPNEKASEGRWLRGWRGNREGGEGGTLETKRRKLFCCEI